MSAFLTFDRLCANRPDATPLFSDLTLAIGRERVGLVGRNGSGKSTLLAIAEGTRLPDGGTVTRAASVGMLRQLPRTTGTVAEALGVAGAMAAMARLEAGEGTPEDAAAARWDLPEMLEAAFAQVGADGLELGRDIAGLSGGERTRLAMVRLLIERPDVLLLDEPTNNLDAPGRSAVATMIDQWTGGVLVASHDRALLERMDRLVELSPVGVTVHGGGWSSFVAARDAARERAHAELDRARRDEAAQRRAAQDRVEKQARRDRAGRAVRARGDLPKILLGARKEQAEGSAGAARALAERQAAQASAATDGAGRKVEVVTPRSFTLPASGLAANRTLLMLEEVTLEQGVRRILGPLSLSVTGPERIALTGANGSGKTSLIRLITGELQPDSGAVQCARDRVAALDQHVSLLDLSKSVVENMLAAHGAMSPHSAHEAAARFAFRNKEGLRAIETMSGGERLRAGLAVVFARPQVPQLLILDEPTNHLDLEAVEELERGLQGYDGALIVVSHDEAFLAAVGMTRSIALT